MGAAACVLAPGRHFLLGSWSPPTLTRLSEGESVRARAWEAAVGSEAR